jgi:hypothetical protein
MVVCPTAKARVNGGRMKPGLNESHAMALRNESLDNLAKKKRFFQKAPPRVRRKTFDSPGF